MFAVLDIEGSGGAYGKERIIEIAVFIYDGHTITDQLISLVNPESPIQPYVSKLTGIYPKMLTRAPRFHEIAKRLVKMTENCVIVGHNVAFDYRMLRQEFSALGFEFNRETLDTIQLSEVLIPGLNAYGLDSVCKELNIYNLKVHRAEGDARATLELFKTLIEKDESKNIFGILSMFSDKPTHIRGEKLRRLSKNLRSGQGVGYIFDKNGKVIYLNTTTSIKAKLTRLFIDEDGESKKFQLMAHRSECEMTGEKWLTQWKLYSAYLHLQPIFNKAQPYAQRQFGIYYDGHSFVMQKKAAKADLYLSNKFIASHCLRQLNRALPEGKVLTDPEMFIRQQLLPSASFRQEFEGRQSGEIGVLIWENHECLGYTFSQIREDTKKAGAEKTLIPLKNDGFGFGIWLEGPGREYLHLPNS